MDLIKLFKSIDAEKQIEIWNEFCDENDSGGKGLKIDWYNDQINNKKDFWECSKDVYDDHCSFNSIEPEWESEVARRVLLSPGYNPNDKYIRDSWDEEAKTCRMVSGNSPIDLIRKVDGKPLYEYDVFTTWFEDYVMNNAFTLKGE